MNDTLVMGVVDDSATPMFNYLDKSLLEEDTAENMELNSDNAESSVVTENIEYEDGIELDVAEAGTVAMSFGDSISAQETPRTPMSVFVLVSLGCVVAVVITVILVKRKCKDNERKIIQSKKKG